MGTTCTWGGVPCSRANWVQFACDLITKGATMGGILPRMVTIPKLNIDTKFWTPQNRLIHNYSSAKTIAQTNRWCASLYYYKSWLWVFCGHKLLPVKSQQRKDKLCVWMHFTITTTLILHTKQIYGVTELWRYRSLDWLIARQFSWWWHSKLPGSLWKLVLPVMQKDSMCHDQLQQFYCTVQQLVPQNFCICETYNIPNNRIHTIGLDLPHCQWDNRCRLNL